MKKSLSGVSIGLFLFAACIFAVRALPVSATGWAAGKNSRALISNGAIAARTDAGSLPNALKSVLSETLGANDPRYRVSRSGGGYLAVNGRNRLTASIGLNGFTARTGSKAWGLRLTAWGMGRRLKKVEAGKAVSEKNRVAIDRGDMVEWWVNGPIGIEQGWTVKNPPHPAEGRGRLTLVLRQSGELRTQALSRGSSLAVSSDSGRVLLRYTGLAAYDKNGKLLPAHFEATRREVRVVVDDRGAAYPVRIDPWVQAAKLTASDSAAYDYLGSSIAVSADRTTVVAGAIDVNVGGNQYQGAVYVFKEPASGWADGTQAAKLTASDGAANDNLGYSVSVSSDGKTVVAGAPGVKVGPHAQQGVVYVFTEPASGWANGHQTAELTASDGAVADELGLSVALSADGKTVAAGPNYSTIGSDPFGNAVYVFEKPASGWTNGTQAAKLTASDGFANDGLGRSVAVSSNGTIVVAGADEAAAVYVFKEPASGWTDGTQAAKLTGSDGDPNDYLGYSVAVSPDGETVVGGADFATVGSNSKQGAVYVFTEPASGWGDQTQAARLTASDGAATDELGFSVAVSAGGVTVVAGARFAAVGSKPSEGAVYVFKEPASGWGDETQTDKLTESDGTNNTFLGYSVAMSPDGTTVVSGAIGADTTRGAVYVFQGPFWQNALDFGGGWEWFDWFGNFNTNNSPWIYHQTLGWLYPAGTSTDSLWFYDPQWDGNGGWWWTGSSFFPWVYSTTESEWLYFDAGDSNPGARWFFTAGGQASTH